MKKNKNNYGLLILGQQDKGLVWKNSSLNLKETQVTLQKIPFGSVLFQKAWEIITP